MNQLKQVLCFGEVLWDNLPTGALPGGAPMNVALHLKRFGIKSLIASSLGNDEKGVRLRNFLESAGMDTNMIQEHPTLPTSEVLVKLNEKNNATFEICEPVAWDEIRLTSALQDELRQSGALVYGSLASRNPVTRDTLVKLLDTDLMKIMDVNLRPPFINKDLIQTLLSKANIVKLNDDELLTITQWYGLEGDLRIRAEEFYKLLGLVTLIVTRGENGASLIHMGQYYEHPGFKVKVADTVGAGDAFLAGFLAAYFDGKDMKSALLEASAIGAFVASKSGAVPEYNEKVIAEFIASIITR